MIICLLKRILHKKQDQTGLDGSARWSGYWVAGVKGIGLQGPRRSKGRPTGSNEIEGYLGLQGTRRSPSKLQPPMWWNVFWVSKNQISLLKCLKILTFVTPPPLRSAWSYYFCLFTTALYIHVWLWWGADLSTPKESCHFTVTFQISLKSTVD